jgi:hypothetical protein
MGYGKTVCAGNVSVLDQKANSQNDDDLEIKLADIRNNFKRINSTTRWSRIEQKDIDGESAEGGEALYYYTNQGLEKMVVRYYGESGQLLQEYYLMDGQLSFVFEKDYDYNHPLYYDEKAMRENGDTQFFDFAQSRIQETRYYFSKNHLIDMLGCQKDEENGVKSFAQQEKDVLMDFKTQLRRIKAHQK